MRGRGGDGLEYQSQSGTVTETGTGTGTSEGTGRGRTGVPAGDVRRRATHLSLDMLQSITVFLSVLTTMKGSWTDELGSGVPCSSSS